MHRRFLLRNKETKTTPELYCHMSEISNLCINNKQFLKLLLFSGTFDASKIGWKRLFLFYEIVSAVICACVYICFDCVYISKYIYIYIYIGYIIYCSDSVINF